jgi:hypothetical protein
VKIGLDWTDRWIDKKKSEEAERSKEAQFDAAGNSPLEWALQETETGLWKNEPLDTHTHTPRPPTAKLQEIMKCKDRLLLLLVVMGWTALPALQGPPPQPHACDPATWEGNLPAFCDTTLSLDQRIDDLVSRLGVDEKVRVDAGDAFSFRLVCLPPFLSPHLPPHLSFIRLPCWSTRPTPSPAKACLDISGGRTPSMAWHMRLVCSSAPLPPWQRPFLR